MTNKELKIDRIRMVKRFLAEKGIRVLQKDIADVERHAFPIPSDDGEFFEHREIYVVILKNGDKYAIMRETVDENGNFSTASARMVTTAAKKIKGGE